VGSYLFEVGLTEGGEVNFKSKHSPPSLEPFALKKGKNS
jgi:hypothetical protein